MTGLSLQCLFDTELLQGILYFKFSLVQCFLVCWFIVSFFCLCGE